MPSPTSDRARRAVTALALVILPAAGGCGGSATRIEPVSVTAADAEAAQRALDAAAAAEKATTAEGER